MIYRNCSVLGFFLVSVLLGSGPFEDLGWVNPDERPYHGLPLFGVVSEQDLSSQVLEGEYRLGSAYTPSECVEKARVFKSLLAKAGLEHLAFPAESEGTTYLRLLCQILVNGVIRLQELHVLRDVQLQCCSNGLDGILKKVGGCLMCVNQGVCVNGTDYLIHDIVPYLSNKKLDEDQGKSLSPQVSNVFSIIGSKILNLMDTPNFRSEGSVKDFWKRLCAHAMSSVARNRNCALRPGVFIAWQISHCVRGGILLKTTSSRGCREHYCDVHIFEPDRFGIPRIAVYPRAIRCHAGHYVSAHSRRANKIFLMALNGAEDVFLPVHLESVRPVRSTALNLEPEKGEVNVSDSVQPCAEVLPLEPMLDDQHRPLLSDEASQVSDADSEDDEERFSVISLSEWQEGEDWIQEEFEPLEGCDLSGGYVMVRKSSEES